MKLFLFFTTEKRREKIKFNYNEIEETLFGHIYVTQNERKPKETMGLSLNLWVLVGFTFSNTRPPNSSRKFVLTV